MSIPNRPGSRAENLYGNMIGQETATPPTNPQSRIEDYLDYILNNGTQLEQEIKDDVDALKGIGRYLSLWDCTTGKPTTDPKKLPYKYKSGDYYIVSAVGATNYMPSGTQYEGTASSTTDSGVSVNDFYLFDGTTWSRMAHSSVESVFVANYINSNNAWSCDKTFDEIKAAYDAGKPCLATVIYNGFTSQYYLRSQNSSNSIWESHYVASVSNGNVYYSTLTHSHNNTVSIGTSSYSILPLVSPSDNGKVLGVSSGAWNKVDPPTALPSVTSSDNGKVLSVVNNNWQPVLKTLIITVSGSEYSPDFSVIYNAINEQYNKPVCVLYDTTYMSYTRVYTVITFTPNSIVLRSDTEIITLHLGGTLDRASQLPVYRSDYAMIGDNSVAYYDAYDNEIEFARSTMSGQFLGIDKGSGHLTYMYPTDRHFPLFTEVPDINYAASLGLSALLMDMLANGSSTQIVDISGPDYKDSADQLISSTAMNNYVAFEYDFWHILWNDVFLPFRVINSAYGVELRAMAVYPVENVGIFNLDITMGFFGLINDGGISNEMIVLSGTATPISSITPIVPPAPPSND